MLKSKKLVISAICIALCTILPMCFHFSENAGILFSPMHIPVLICGLICGSQYGVLCGLLGPVLSSITMGMPMPPRLPGMMIELAVYGFVTGFLMKKLYTKSLYIDLYISLIAAMLLGRIAGGIVNGLFFMAGNYSFMIWFTGYFVSCVPGIILQVLLIPTIVYALVKADIIPEKYC